MEEQTPKRGNSSLNVLRKRNNLPQSRWLGTVRENRNETLTQCFSLFSLG